MQRKNKSFKIIGLRVLNPCSQKLRKVLNVDETYFLCNDYEDDGNGHICLKSNASELSDSFFRIPTQDKTSPYVSISCIVGHNGDGKSSLVELMIRTINNFAYLAGYRNDHPELKYIPGLYTKLYYLVDTVICCIHCNGDTVELIVDGSIKWSRSSNPLRKGEGKVKKYISRYADVLFYTLVNNYSLYSYNSEDFKCETSTIYEDDSWISSLFHKNDAYQTPVVLVPMRNRGVIDVNREHELTMQRLAELFLNCDTGKYHISETEIVEGFMYKLERSSKLFTYTVESYCLDEYRGGKDIIELYQSYQRNKYAINLKNDTVKKNNIDFWCKFDHSFFDFGLMEYCFHLLDKEGYIGKNPDKTDLAKYLDRLKKYKDCRQNIAKFIANRGDRLHFLQFQRLYLIYEIYKKWNEIIPNIECSLFSNVILGAKEHAVAYLIYKTIRIIENYPEFFSGGISDYQMPQHFFNNSVRENNINKWFKNLLEDINEGKSHMTLKLRQIIYYLTHLNQMSFLDEGDTADESIVALLEANGYERYMDCEKYYNAVKNDQDFSASVLPPIFSKDFLISRNSSSPYQMSRMSSGERQLLNSASSIVYHLKNITKSVTKGLKVAYYNVNVILEEVELYFHPEYQRQFIKYLLEQIGNAGLPANLAINMIFVTHSPFVLSDVPRQNVLFLNNGKPVCTMQEDTFGANIHTLLQNGFFLNSVPIGEFAKSKINQMFAILNQSSAISVDILNRLEKEILLVSEPLLRGQLIKLLTQRRNLFHQDDLRRIEQLEKLVESLQKQIYDKN